MRLETPRPALLAAPLVFIALTLAGMRMLFAIPSEIRANWTVRTRTAGPHPPGAGRRRRRAHRLRDPAGIPRVESRATALWGPFAPALIHAAFCAALASCSPSSRARSRQGAVHLHLHARQSKFVKLWPVYLTAFLSTPTRWPASSTAAPAGGISRH